MRVLLFIILVSSLGYAQIEKNNGQVIWRAVEQYETDANQLLKEMKSSGKFSGLELLDDEIIGKFEDAPIIYQGTASMYLMASNLMGSFIIQFKEGRYRITTTNIKFAGQTSVGVFTQGSVESIEKYALNRKGEFRKRFESKDIPILEESLSRLFEFSQNDDW